MNIQPHRFKWHVHSPSRFEWEGVNVVYLGREPEFGWRIVDGEYISPDAYFCRDDAIRDAEYVNAMPILVDKL